MTVGWKIRNLRKKMKISQAELGKILNKSQGTIAKYENNIAEMDYDTMATLCSYAGWTLDYLLGKPSSSVLQESDHTGDLKYALFNGDANLPPEAYEEIKDFAEFVKNKYQNKDKK